jgi:hypothetical protein
MWFVDDQPVSREGAMDIRQYADDGGVFGPDEIKAMSMALDDVCRELKLDSDAKAREIVAIRIIELALRGERSPTRLRDQLLREANGGTGC